MGLIFIKWKCICINVWDRIRLINYHHSFSLKLKEEGLQQGYQPGFTSDDLMKLVFQRYGKSDKGGALETVDESKASEPILEDESANNQKRAYPRPVPASNSLLAEQSEVWVNKLWLQ